MSSVTWQGSNQSTTTIGAPVRRDPMATAMAIVGLVTVAAIHWAQVVPLMKDTPYLGTAFLLLTLACIGLAIGLLVSDRPAVWILVSAVSGVTITGYIFTRTVSTFFDDQDVGDWSEPLGMVSLLVETLLVMLSIYWVVKRRDALTPLDEYSRLTPSIDVRTGNDTDRDRSSDLRHP